MPVEFCVGLSIICYARLHDLNLVYSGCYVIIGKKIYKENNLI